MKKFLLLCFSFVIATTVWAQREVSGRVSSAEDGTTLPGVNVVLKGTTNGTVSDANGNYKMSIPDGNGTIVFSFIGLKSQEVEIGGRAVIDVKMELDVTQLSEVVVTTAGGLQSRQRELGSSITVLTPNSLTAGKAVNLAAGMQGKVAGFQINATSSGVNPEYRLILRGQRSLTGNNQALIILDNVIVPNAVLSNLNMNDVESVNILQGAGAAALYGSQASNGAVIITTKRGKAGTVEITLQHNVQATQVAFFPKIQKGFGSGGSAYGIDGSTRPVFNYLENQSYGPAFDNSLRPLGPKLEDGTQPYTNYNYKPGHNDFWNVGLTNQTDFSVSAGDATSSIYMSGQYVTVAGTTPGDKFTRANVRVNGWKKITDKVQISFSTSLAPNKYDISSATGSIYTNMLNMPSNVDITQFKDWSNNKFATPNGFYNPWYGNPYFTAANNRQLDKNLYITGNMEVKWTPIPGLDIIARQGISNRTFTEKATTGQYIYSLYARNTDQSSKSNIAASVSETANTYTNLVTDALAQYNKSIGQSVSLNVVAGTQLIQNTGRYMNTNISGLIVKDLYNLSNGTGNPGYSENDFQSRLVGVYGKVTGGFKDYLFVTLTGRNDSDSRLNKDNRSFFYPSAEASLVLTEAIPSLKDGNIFTFFKLRGNVSKTGQVNLGNPNFSSGFSDFGAYYTQSTFSSNTSYATANGFPYGSLAGYSADARIVNPNLKPEFTHQWEIGADMNFWNDNITTSLTWYHSRTDNQTIATSISNSTGFSNFLTNVGETSSQGLEFTGHITPVRTQNFQFTVGGNYTYLKNTVVSISDQLPLVGLASSGNAVSAAVAGQAFPVIMGLDYQRDDQGHVIVDRTTGLPSSTSSNVILGNGTPKHRVGADAAVQYKNFKFSILFEYRGGYSVYNGVGTEMDWSGTGYRTAQYGRQSFIFPNSVYKADDGSYVQNTSVSIANGNGNNGYWSDGINRNTSSNYVTSGNFIKLREISLGYDIPPIFGKAIKGANISVQGRNLFLWMAKDNYYTDPEYSTAGSTGNGTGLNDIGQTPPTRYYGATLSIKL
ncbi:MAG: SusC/RagA family TonB-linked outer membrane protein [Bacteroidota bacterium]